MTTSERLAREFEALICEVQVLSIKIEGMKVANRERELQYEFPVYKEDDFLKTAKEMKQFAAKFRKLGT